jgi:transposase
VNGSDSKSAGTPWSTLVPAHAPALRLDSAAPVPPDTGRFCSRSVRHRGWQFYPGSLWGLQTGPNPTDRAKLGSKRHLICDGRGVPLAIQLTGANRNDLQQALALVDAIPSFHGERGRPRHRPDCVLGDRGDDAESIRQCLRARRIVPWLAKRNTEHGSGLGRWRWVVERTFAWLNQFRRLRVRYVKRADIHEAFLSLGCALICWRFLRVDWVAG